MSAPEGVTAPDRAGAADEAGVSDSAAREFTELRPAMFGAAYRVLGSVADAEDVVQESWLRWAAVDRAEVRDARAFLITVATRLALNRVRQQRRRRESYVGPWLPEPISTTGDAADAVEIADSVSMAMLVVLETLSPLERAAFVLREVFELPFAEIASTLDRSEAAVRQLAHRARSHVQARRPRAPVAQAEHREVTQRFLRAASTGDLDGLLELLAADAVLVTDGGGIKRAALRPIHGADPIARWLLGVLGKQEADGAELAIEFAAVNGESALVLFVGNTVDSVGFLTIEDVGITALHLVRNPAKLAALSGLRPTS